MVLSQRASKGNGTLVLLGATIGNKEDFPARSLKFIQQADLLIFEEDRPARQALKSAGIHRDYLKLTEHAEQLSLELAESALTSGKTVCYMSDQGMPNLADPGRLLLDLAYKHKSEILIVPGPSSVTAAISACRFIDSGFYFVGFLPRKSEERIQKLVSLKNFPDPIILLDTAYRRQNLLQDLLTALGPDRRLMIAMDITGPTERYIEAKSSQIIEILQDEEQDKNFVLIIDRASRKL